MSIEDEYVNQWKEKMLSHREPLKILYEWVRTGRINFPLFRALFEAYRQYDETHNVISGQDIGNPDKFV